MYTYKNGSVTLLLFIRCLMLQPLGVGFCVGFVFCAVVLAVLFSLVTVLLRKRAGNFILSVTSHINYIVAR